MLIEQKTTYSYKLKYLKNPTFDKVRGFAKKFIDDLPKELVEELYSQLERGVVQIDSEPQMLVYLYSFGNMHQAKLNKAFENIPELFFEQLEINIIDYGCGQAVGTMCYVDFIRHKGISQKVKRVTLIEPSEICLKRAALHVSAFCSDAEIVTINKTFDDLDAADIVCDEEIPTLHILSNVLDLEFDLERFAELISDNLKGYNQFVCVGPYFNVPATDQQMDDFAKCFSESEDNYSKIFSKFELNPNKAWTAHIRCFSVGELEVELSTKVTKEDIENGIKDEDGVVYSRDGKRLLKVELTDLYGLSFGYMYTIPNAVSIICDDAFHSGKFLQHIIIPNTVKGIGVSAFEDIESLKQVTISDSVTSIGECAFRRCKSLQQITIPNSVTSIEASVFEWCESLQQIMIPNSVISIGEYAFRGCVSLQQITIPISIIKIERSAFEGCESLQQITIPNSVTSILKNTFCHCKSLQQITIPNSVKSIEESAFFCCKSLQQITIPNSVTSIEGSAFYGCESLQQISIPNSVTSIEGSAFYGCESLQQITIPNSVTSIGSSTFWGCKSIQRITIPNSVTSIGGGAFNSCVNLNLISDSDCFVVQDKMLMNTKERILISFWGTEKSVTIPNFVTSIGEEAFYRCDSLQQITIPNSVMNIGDLAFWECGSLQQITILNSIVCIENNAFIWCYSLERIIIPEGSGEHFKQMLPKELWDKLYYLKKVLAPQYAELQEVESQGGDDLPF